MAIPSPPLTDDEELNTYLVDLDQEVRTLIETVATPVVVPPTAVEVTGTAVDMAAGGVYWCTNTGAQTTVTLPLTADDLAEVTVINGTGRTDLLVARNTHNIMGLAEDMLVDKTDISVTLMNIAVADDWRII